MWNSFEDAGGASLRPATTVTSVVFSFLLSAILTFVYAPPAFGAKANLPYEDRVAPGKRMGVDGVYRLTRLNRKVRIDRGRLIALEGWKHALLWDVVPGMVVVRDISYEGKGRFSGRDLLVPSDWNAVYDTSTKRLQAEVTTVFGPFSYELIPDSFEESGDSGYDGGYDDLEQEEVIERVVARRMGNAAVAGTCPGKQSYLSRGACWTCPSGYRRTSPTRAMDHAKACIKRKTLTGPFSRAKQNRVARQRCPINQFHVAESGINGCYSCPTGYARDDEAPRNSVMCVAR